MAKRNHPLQIGEKVYNLDHQFIYHITEINNDGSVDLSMTNADMMENHIMFDCEISADEFEVTAFDPDRLYQFVPGLVARDGNDICYEHQETEDDYPYFSPYLYENLFAFETFTFTPEEYDAR